MGPTFVSAVGWDKRIALGRLLVRAAAVEGASRAAYAVGSALVWGQLLLVVRRSARNVRVQPSSSVRVIREKFASEPSIRRQSDAPSVTPTRKRPVSLPLIPVSMALLPSSQ